MTSKWKRIKPTVVTKVGWRTVVSKTFIDPDGQELVFDTKEPEGAINVATLALTKGKKVILARQFRQGPELYLDELPGGGAGKNEAPIVAARRELIEETGYDSNRIEELGVCYKDAYTNAYWQYFIAYDCEKVVQQKLDNGEHAMVVLANIDELISNAKNGKMTDSGAVLLAIDKLDQIRREK